MPISFDQLFSKHFALCCQHILDISDRHCRNELTTDALRPSNRADARCWPSYNRRLMEPCFKAPTLDVLLQSRQCACSPSLALVCRLKLSVDLTSPQALHSFCSGTCRQRVVEHDQSAETREI